MAKLILTPTGTGWEQPPTIDEVSSTEEFDQIFIQNKIKDSITSISSGSIALFRGAFFRKKELVELLERLDLDTGEDDTLSVTAWSLAWKDQNDISVSTMLLLGVKNHTFQAEKNIPVLISAKTFPVSFDGLITSQVAPVWSKLADPDSQIAWNDSSISNGGIGGLFEDWLEENHAEIVEKIMLPATDDNYVELFHSIEFSVPPLRNILIQEEVEGLTFVPIMFPRQWKEEDGTDMSRQSVTLMVVGTDLNGNAFLQTNEIGKSIVHLSDNSCRPGPAWIKVIV
jgi:hypothetical protein